MTRDPHNMKRDPHIHKKTFDRKETHHEETYTYGKRPVNAERDLRIYEKRPTGKS